MRTHAMLKHQLVIEDHISRLHIAAMHAAIYIQGIWHGMQCIACVLLCFSVLKCVAV